MSTQLAETTGPDLLWGYVERARPEIERALASHLPRAPEPFGRRFNEALGYALFPGGKRLRPVLTLLGAEAVGGPAAAVMPAAVAVEFVHTCSLIFDDLPCMDDAEERRGRESLHRRYGESTAVLAALSLLNCSYPLVLRCEAAADHARAVRAHAELVECIGTNGMVTGQTVDLSEGAGGGDELGTVRNLKTSALMRTALRLGAILSGAGERQLSALTRYAELLGEAYQITDDVQDIAEDAALAGATSRPQTLAFRRGVGGARRRAATLLGEAKESVLGEFGPTRGAQRLCALADHIAAR
jgi:geranylgeranyl diphosphate synthase, type II